MSGLIFNPLDTAAAQEILSWRYAPPYDIYNLSPQDAVAHLGAFLDPINGYCAMTDHAGALLAFCCFGAEARVAGYDYAEPALDIGLGLRPDLAGQGHGLDYVNAVLAFARMTFGPPALRVTIAAFNQRAQRVWTRAGFRRVGAFARPSDKMRFTVFVREE
jgi:RimJ/RimL family protein N-acetyltransferase